MPISEVYRKQVSLLVQALPYIARETDFALKGGTAINLFVRNLPRLLGDPDWNKLRLAGVENLPAIKWKLTNVGKLDEGTRRANARKLAGIWP